jgi:hypothetical protein
MTLHWRYAEPIENKLMTLEEPGKPLPFDADRGLVEEVTAQCDIGALMGELKGKDERSAREALEAFGRRLLEITIELADGKYMDQRYVELAILASRPTDRWNVTTATTSQMVLQVTNCSANRAMVESGLAIPCEAMCLACFGAAAAKTGDALDIEMTRSLPKDGMCEFTFSLRPQV